MTSGTRRPAGLACLPLDQTTPRVASNPELIAAGWQRRYLADHKRAEEAQTMYAELGYDVLLENPDPAQFDSDCGDCANSACSAYVVIYTRRTNRG